MKRVLLSLSLLGLTVALARCPTPAVATPDDFADHGETGTISGRVIVYGPRRGNVVVLLASAESPPPPDGFGRPTSIAYVNMEEIFKDQLLDKTAVGPFSAPFSFSLVAPGDYIVTGWLDNDTCVLGDSPCRSADFKPWYIVTNGGNQFDIRGAATASDDPTNTTPRTVSVRLRQDGGIESPTDVNINFTPKNINLTDRPVFVVRESDGGIAEQAVYERKDFEVPLPDGGKSFKLFLGSLQLYPYPVEAGDGIIQEPNARFVYNYVDRNDSGSVDPIRYRPDGGVLTTGDTVSYHPDLPLIFDRWPKVIIRRLSEEDPFLDENFRPNGSKISPGFDYEHVGPGGKVIAPDLEGDVVLIGGLSTPELTPFPDGGRPFFGEVPSINFIIGSLAMDGAKFQPRKNEVLERLKEIPSGEYGIYIVNSNGTYWRLPNELDGTYEHLGFPKVPGQGFRIIVR